MESAMLYQDRRIVIDDEALSKPDTGTRIFTCPYSITFGKTRKTRKCGRKFHSFEKLNQHLGRCPGLKTLLPFAVERVASPASPKADLRPSLVDELKNTYSHLLKVQGKCTEIEQGRCRNIGKTSDPNSAQWDALEATNRTLLNKYHDVSIHSSSLNPNLQHFRKVVHGYSLQSRNLRRFNDCLLPLLRREQDLESAQQWMEMMRLSSSLIDVLGKDEVLYSEEERELLDTADQIENVLMELESWFRRRYKSLNSKKDVTEEPGLVEVIFEFPNNFRHICTTMPWTVRPALLILWGVCWMFIIFGASPPGRPGQDELKTVEPLVSPVPVLFDFSSDPTSFNFGDVQPDSIIDDGDDTGYISLGIMDDFFSRNMDMMNDPNDALAFSQATPQDPNFLVQDLMSRHDTESVDLTGRDSTEPSSTIPIQSSSLGGPHRTGDTCAKDATGSTDANGSDDRTLGSNVTVTNTKPRVVCPDCQKTFATSFTLTRHQTESRQRSEQLFPCPNRGCKKSIGKSPFKRQYNLERHLKTCKHHQECLSQPEDRIYSTLASQSTPASQREEVETEQAITVHRMNKRPRLEDDEGSDDLLLAGILKKYKKMKEEVRQKEVAYLHAQESLRTLEKTIEVLRGSQRDP